MRIQVPYPVEDTPLPISLAVPANRRQAGRALPACACLFRVAPVRPGLLLCPPGCIICQCTLVRLSQRLSSIRSIPALAESRRRQRSSKRSPAKPKRPASAPGPWSLRPISLPPEGAPRGRSRGHRRLQVRARQARARALRACASRSARCAHVRSLASDAQHQTRSRRRGRKPVEGPEVALRCGCIEIQSHCG